MTPASQRTFAFGLGMLIGGGGQVVGHMAPWVLEQFNVANVAPAGMIPTRNGCPIALARC